MYCPYCGQQTEDGVVFCPFCGGKIERDKNTKSGETKKRSKKPFWLVAAAMVCVVAIVLLIPKAINPNFSYSSYLKGRSHYLLEYLTDVGNQPLLVYDCKIAKDAQVYNIYVITDEGCRTYHPGVTLGELSKMTDEEILEMLESKYQDGLNQAILKWKSDSGTNFAIAKGEVHLYQPRSFPVKGCLLTDETGNRVKGELIFFPVSGVGRTPYVIEHTTEQSDLRYYGTTADNSSYYKTIKFKEEYFGTGYGAESDVNQINNVYYVTPDSVTTGTVYDSHYYGMGSDESDWAEAGRFCVRVDNPDKFTLEFDELDSSAVAYVDPTENEILTVSRSYYNGYYNSFAPLQ